MNKICKPPKSLTLIEAIQKLKTSNAPILVKFFTTWCGACQEAKAAVHAAKCELEGEMETVAIDTDEQGMIASEFGIESLPTVAIIQNGQVMAQTEGAESATQYVEMARSWLKDNGFNDN